MENAVIGWDNRLDKGTLSGGSWEALLPLDNLKQSRLSKTARSTDLQTTNTQFTLDHSTNRHDRLYALIDHNMTTEAEVRITTAETVGELDTNPVLDTGFIDIFDAIFPSTALEWEDDNWWSGKPSDDDLQGIKRNFIFLNTALTVHRYVRFELRDPTNPDGYIDIGRTFIGPVWQFEHNHSYGASVGFESQTLVDKSLGGVAFFDKRDAIRVARFSLDFMDKDEGFAQAFELTRRRDVDGEVLWLPIPDDKVHQFREAFWGRLRTLNLLENAAFELHGMAFEVEEIK